MRDTDDSHARVVQLGLDSDVQDLVDDQYINNINLIIII